MLDGFSFVFTYVLSKQPVGGGAHDAPRLAASAARLPNAAEGLFANRKKAAAHTDSGFCYVRAILRQCAEWYFPYGEVVLPLCGSDIVCAVNCR